MGKRGLVSRDSEKAMDDSPCEGLKKRNIIVIGASAGGVEALTRLVKSLPVDLPAAVFVTLHFPSYGTSFLPNILNRCKTLLAQHPYDGQRIEFNRIYIAPPNEHLLFRDRHIHLGHGPRENGHRPAIDVMFRSAARAYKQQVIGVILSGMLDDGTAGLKVIKAHGGVALVQDPNEAAFNSMPRSALEYVRVDAILKLTDLANRLAILADSPAEERNSMTDTFENEAEQVAQSKGDLEQGEHPDLPPSTLTCPDCGGVLWEIRNNGMLRYRCHVGHVYSMDSLVSEQANAVETALWSAIRALEEKAALARRMAAQAREQQRVVLHK